MLEFIIQNKEILKFFYTFAIAAICAAIVLKTDRLFNLSSHQGIRYLRNAFLFYGVGFIIRSLTEVQFLPSQFLKVIFEFSLIMAGFFLLYSLLWKKIEIEPKENTSSLFNPKIAVFYFLALTLALLDSVWQTYSFMFFSQIALYAFASVISFQNYKNRGKERKFLKFYFIAMVLSLGAWTLNAVTALLLQWNQTFVISVYIINLIIFSLFLYGVVNVTRGK